MDGGDTFNVAQWLVAQGFEKYVTNFASNSISTPELLLTLSMEELKDDLKITNLGDRKRILLAIKQLEESEDEESSTSEEQREHVPTVGAPTKITARNAVKVGGTHTKTTQCFAGGLFGCFADLETCFCSFVCPCIQFGRNVEALYTVAGVDLWKESYYPGGGGGDCRTALPSFCCLVLTILPLPYIFGISHCLTPLRMHVRKYLGMQVDTSPSHCECDDCLLSALCPCCTLAQEARALSNK